MYIWYCIAFCFCFLVIFQLFLFNFNLSTVCKGRFLRRQFWILEWINRFVIKFRWSKYWRSEAIAMISSLSWKVLCWFSIRLLIIHYDCAVWSRDSLLVRVLDSSLKGCGFESRQEWQETFLLRSQLLCADSYLVSVPPPCYHSGM